MDDPSEQHCRGPVVISGREYRCSGQRRDHRDPPGADVHDDVDGVGAPFWEEVAAGEEEGEIHAFIDRHEVLVSKDRLVLASIRSQLC